MSESTENRPTSPPKRPIGERMAATRAGRSRFRIKEAGELSTNHRQGGRANRKPLKDGAWR